MNHGDTKITEKTIGAAIEVHRHCGPGLLESVYEAALSFELGQSGLPVQGKKSFSVNYNRLVN